MRRVSKAVSILALFMGITMTGAETVKLEIADEETSPTIGRVKHCEDVGGDVKCKMPGAYGDRDFCFYSLCEAQAAGAVACKPAIPVCEPH